MEIFPGEGVGDEIGGEQILINVIVGQFFAILFPFIAICFH